MTLKLAFTDAGEIVHAPGSVISGGTFTIATPADLKISVTGLGVYFGSLSFTFLGGSSAGFVDGSVSGGGTIAATAGFVKTPTGFILREGDAGTLVGTGVLSAGGPGAVSGGVELGDPAQTKWSAE